MARRRRRAACFALLVAAFAGCAGEAPPLPLRLGSAPVPAYALVSVALDEGLLAREGVALTHVPYPSGRDALEAALRGEVDVAAAFATPIVREAFQGTDLAVVSTLYRGEGFTALVARPGSGIAETGDVRGRRIGVTPGTNVELFAEVLLAEAGLARGDVVLVEDAQDQLVERLARGEIDAAALWTPHRFTAPRRLGAGAVVLTTAAYTEVGILVGSRAHVAARAEAVRRLLRALVEAERLVASDPGVYAASVRPRFPELTDEEVRSTHENARFSVSLSNLLLTVLRQEAAWLEEQGVHRRPGVRMRDLLAQEHLLAAHPHAVTLFEAVAREGADQPP